MRIIKHKEKIRVITIFSFILVIFFSGYCFAKYEITKNIINSSKVAIPVLEVKGMETTKISALNTQGYYDFIVKNYNENKISDVPQNYYIEIITTPDEAISYELYKENEKINLINNKTNKIFIQNSKQIEHSYRLKVSYDKTKSNKEKDILDDIQIKVHSEQSKN